MRIQQQTKEYTSFNDKIITIYLTLKPLYFAESGSIQICDIFLILSVLWIVFQNGGKVSYGEKEGRWVNTFTMICVYQFVVNFIWYVRYTDSQFIISSMYYIFNLIAVFAVCTLNCVIGTDRVVKSLVDGCYYSTIVTGVGLVINLGKQFRNTSFFNNPNQLGLHAIIMLTVLCLYWNCFSKKRRIVVIGICVWSVIASLSKAAFISMVFIGIAMIVNSEKGNRRSQLIRNMVLLVAAAGTLYFFLYSNNGIVLNNSTLYSLRVRMLQLTLENDSNLGTGRGYNRVFEMGNNILWGMGEGGFDRFESLKGLEIHSTYINILVSYGVIGAIGYLYLYLRILGRNRTFHKLLALFGILLYGISHNGIRNSIMWIMFAIIILSEDLHYHSYLQSNDN